MSPFILVFAGLVSIAIVWQLLTMLMVWENRRYFRRRIGHVDYKFDRFPSVEIIIPCKGKEINLESNMRRFFEQSYRNYSVLFVLEEPNDGATEIVDRLLETFPGRGRIIFSGKANLSGQKVHNLQVAVANLKPETEVIVFADSDARPHAHWLINLVDVVWQNAPCAATGYRWMYPVKNTVPELLVYSMNSAIASSLGNRRFNLIWGGSWAIRRDVFDDLDIANAWSGSLSDDFVASRVVRNAGLDVHYVPQALCISHTHFSFHSAVEFIRRQLVITRRHLFRLWLGGFGILLLVQLGFWFSLITGIYFISRSPTISVLAFSSSLAIYFLHVFKAAMRQKIGSLRFPIIEQKCKRAILFDMWCMPIHGLFGLACFFTSMTSNTIRWRGVSYHIGAAGKITMIGRSLQMLDRRPLAVIELMKKEGLEPDELEPPTAAEGTKAA